MTPAISPRRLIVIGIILMVLGWVLAALLVMRILESTFFLNFVAFMMSNAGLFLGLAGLGLSAQVRRNKRNKDDDPYLH